MTELQILAAYGLLVLLTILLQVLGSLSTLSMGYLMSSRDEPRDVGKMTARITRALDNSITAMALFAPAILLIHVQGKADANSLLAAQVFLAARVIYLPVYAVGVPTVRTLAWLAGFAATAILYFLAL